MLLANARHLFDLPTTLERVLGWLLTSAGVADPYAPIDDLPWRGPTDGFGTPITDPSARVVTYGEARAAGWLDAAGAIIPGKEDALRSAGMIPGCPPDVWERARLEKLEAARPKRRRRAAAAATL